MDDNMEKATERNPDADVHGLNDQASYTSEEERHVLRKIDRNLLPLLCIGIYAACLAAMNGFAAFTAVRVLLGFFEVAIQPAFVIIGFGALLMYGIGLSKETTLATWRIMFLVRGGGTLLAGLLFLTLAPRLSKKRQTFNKSKIWESLTDVGALILVLGGFFNNLASPVIKFATLVTNGFGWSKLNAMMVRLPAGTIQILFIWIVVIGIPLVGNFGIAALLSSFSWGIVVCTWLATILTPQQIVYLSLNIKGNTKKAAASNGYFVLYAAACIAGPQLWTKPPRHTDGIITDISFWVSAAWENRRRDRSNQVADENENGDVDLTDKRDTAFRYTW
ncbi:hypothetical protein BJX99DRAFT_245766 [Aspergillus californicus]